MAVVSCSAWISVSPSQDLLDRLTPHARRARPARRQDGRCAWVSKRRSPRCSAPLTALWRHLMRKFLALARTAGAVCARPSSPRPSPRTMPKSQRRNRRNPCEVRTSGSMFSPRLKNKPGPRDLTRSVCCQYSSNYSINCLSKLHKFSALMDEAEADVAGLLGFPKEHRARHTRSTP
jgi:hypothetical protein